MPDSSPVQHPAVPKGGPAFCSIVNEPLLDVTGPLQTTPETKFEPVTLTLIVPWVASSASMLTKTVVVSPGSSPGPSTHARLPRPLALRSLVARHVTV